MKVLVEERTGDFALRAGDERESPEEEGALGGGPQVDLAVLLLRGELEILCSVLDDLQPELGREERRRFVEGEMRELEGVGRGVTGAEEDGTVLGVLLVEQGRAAETSEGHHREMKGREGERSEPG